MNKLIAFNSLLLAFGAASVASLISSITLASAQTTHQLYEHSSCRSTVESETISNMPQVKVQKVTFTEIPGQGFVEVSALIYGWSPTSETSSGYYYLVSATCQRVGNDLKVWNEMGPYEGGVTVKTITKERF